MHDEKITRVWLAENEYIFYATRVWLSHNDRARAPCQKFVRLDLLWCVFHVNYEQVTTWFRVQFGNNKHLKNLLVYINTKLHQTKLLPIQEKQTKKQKQWARYYVTKQTEKKENTGWDTNVTNRKERKQCARYKRNKQTEKKENNARDTNVTNKQKRKKTMREIQT